MAIAGRTDEMDNSAKDIKDRINISIGYKRKMSPEPWFKAQYLNTCEKKRKFIIAAISVRLEDPDDFESVVDENFKLLKIKNKMARKVKDCIQNSCQRAVDSGAKIIVYSELSYPLEEDEALRKYLSKLCKENDCIVIAGSYHDTRADCSLYGTNCSLIFTPYQEEPIIQIKHQRGRFAGSMEKIKIPDDRITNIFITKYGTFSVCVCVDILNENLLNNISVLNNINNVYIPIDFLFVPSYTDDPNTIVNASKRFSAITKTAVMTVFDGYFGDHIKLFVGGEEKQSKKMSKMQGEPLIRLFKIDLCDVTKIRNEYYKSIKWTQPNP